MNEISIELLKLLTQADSIPSHESEVREIFRHTGSNECNIHSPSGLWKSLRDRQTFQVGVTSRA